MTTFAPLFAMTSDGHLSLRYQCSCSWTSDVSQLDHDRGDAAYNGVRGHIADDHSAEFEVGRCGECGEPTDYFRAHFPNPTGATVEIVDVFLCERHAPRPMIVDQAGADDVDQGDDDQGAGDDAPYNVLRSVRFSHREGLDQ